MVPLFLEFGLAIGPISRLVGAFIFMCADCPLGLSYSVNGMDLSSLASTECLAVHFRHMVPLLPEFDLSTGPISRPGTAFISYLEYSIKQGEGCQLDQSISVISSLL